MNVAAARVARPSTTWNGTGYLIAVFGGLLPVFASHSLWFIPVGALLTYMYMGYDPARTGGYVLEFGDSVYYLGFTLSVGSLLAALEPFKAHGDFNPVTTFQYFGLGMFTTLVGVAARTAIQLYHRTPSETIEAMNTRVARTASALIDQLDQVQRQTTALSEGLATKTAEIVGPSIEVFQQQFGSLTKAYRNLAEHAESLSQGSRTAQESIATINRSMLQLTNDLKDHVAALADLTKEATDAYSNLRGGAQHSIQVMQASAVETHRHLIAINSGLQEFSDKLRPEELGLSELRATGAAAATALKRLTSNADLMTDAVQKNGGALRTVHTAQEELLAQIRQNSASVNAFTSALNELDRTWKARADLEKAEVDRIRAQSRELTRVLDEIVEAVELKLERIR